MECRQRQVIADLRMWGAVQLTDKLLVGMLEAAPDAVVCVDADGRIVLVNAQTERLFGYRREELAGQLVEILVPDAIRPGHPARRAGYVADPRPRQMGEGIELAGRRRDGSTFPAEISLSAIDTGESILVMAAVRDVTERREASATAARLASIIQSSHDAVIGESLDGVITSWNPGAERLYGYSAAEMIGRHIEVLILPETRAAEKETQAAITRGDQVEQFQSDRVRKDGTTVRVSTTLSPIADRAGVIVGVSTVSRDITGQQRADARFRGLLEAAPDAMVCVDADGRIVLVNAQTERLFGYRREELAGQLVEILVPDAIRPGHPARRAAYMADPRPRQMGEGIDLAGRRRDGSTFPAEISLSAIDTGENILVMAAVRDVRERLELQAERERLKTQAERDRLERQLHQSQRLESLGQLAGGVAHDFNNLLAVISNYAAFVAEEIDTKTPQQEWQAVREDIQQVQRAAERAAGLTHQLLAFARRDVIQPRALNLNRVIEGVEQLLVRTLGEHVELSTRLAAGLQPVLSDPGQIEQVLVNLAVNARDAMPGGGKLIVTTASTSIDEEHAASRVGLSAGPYVSLKVSDTGTGMPQDVIDRAFEPFFTTKAKGEGTGLGLATVYGIVTQIGRLRADLLGTGARHHLHHLAAGDQPARRGAVGAVGGRPGRLRRDRARGGGRGGDARGDPPDPRPQRLPGDHRRQRTQCHRGRSRAPRRHRHPGHRRRDAANARQGGQREDPRPLPGRQGAVHVRLYPGSPGHPGHHRNWHQPHREAVHGTIAAGQAPRDHDIRR